MQEEIAKLVHPVISYGLDLKARLDDGDEPMLDVEQAALKGLLLGEAEARRWSSFGGDIRPSPIDGPTEPARRAEQFLGIRYALVCWLDELFTVNSPWETAWNERKLEVALYGTNDRAWKFWDQARQAETRPETDPLEVFFLCVMLGFTGELREDPDRLAAWVAAAQSRVTGARGRDWSPPLDLDPPTFVPPLRGRERMQYLLITGAVTLTILVPALVFLIVQNIGG